MATERITVTLPEEIVRDIDRRERNRSKFIAQAVRNELEHRRREELRRSLSSPHPETEHFAELGVADWSNQLGEGDDDLVDPDGGQPVSWRPGEGWVEIQ